MFLLQYTSFKSAKIAPEASVNTFSNIWDLFQFSNFSLMVMQSTKSSDYCLSDASARKVFSLLGLLPGYPTF